MKKLIVAFIMLGLFSCKKKEEVKKEEPAPVTAVPASTNSMSAKINGASWAVSGNQTKDAKIDQGVDPGPPKLHVFIGRGEASMYKNAIHLWAAYTTGTVTLGPNSESDAMYFDATGQPNYVKTGTMNISLIDTSHVKSQYCDKFKATFSFITDSVGGVGYSIEQGVIDFEAP